MGEGEKLATVNFKWDKWDTPKFNEAKPYIVNQNETNLTLSNRGVKFDRSLTWNADMT